MQSDCKFDSQTHPQPFRKEMEYASNQKEDEYRSYLYDNGNIIIIGVVGGW